MNHLSDPFLNEYLDGALSPQERSQIQSHLDTCAACRSRLEQLESLFRTLSALPEETPSSGLLPAIVSQIRPSTPINRWMLVLALQSVAAAALILVILPSLVELNFIFPPNWSQTDLPSINLPSLGMELYALPAMFEQLLNFSFTIPSTPDIDLTFFSGFQDSFVEMLPQTSILLLTGSAILAAFAANFFLLFRAKSEKDEI